MQKYLLIAVFIALAFTSCKKESEDFKPLTVNDYFPLKVGDYLNYDLDSTVFVNFGTVRKIVSYQIQDRVDDSITDNLGRPSFRVLRFIRKDATMPWSFNNTFSVTNTGGSIEYVENNQRFIKLQFPLRQDFSWKGNSYINTTSVEPDMRFLDNWDYTYDSVNMPITLNALTIDSTIKVMEKDDFIGQDPSIPGTLYGEKTYSVEKYAKGIGLVYREFLHWIYQGQEGRAGYYNGYGLKLTFTGKN